MTSIEKRVFQFLLFVCLVSIVISMVAGPYSADTIALAASACAIIISLSLAIYGLYFWKNGNGK